MALTNFVKSIRNIMRNDAGINGDAQRIEQIAWMLFLKVYDEKENDWEFNEDNYVSFIPEDCRWRNWAKDDGTGKAMTADALLDFVNNTLFPTLKKLEVTPTTPMRSAIVQTTFQDANQYMKDGVLLRQVINVIDQLDLGDYEESHAFGEIYEAILKEMQSAGSAGEFYTPRALTDFMAEIIQPKVGEKMADFACGTGGFITSWLNALDKKVKTAEDREQYAESVFGIEKKQFPYMLCVTNMLLHDIDSPKIMHDNSLAKDVLNYTDDDKFDVVLMNPPYGGSEKNDIKKHFPSDLSSSETADLFMVLIMHRLKENGRAAVILPDGFLFGTDNAKMAIKEKLLREFNVHTIIRLPGSIFSPYTSINTNIIFFNNEKAEGVPEGFSTKETWFYRLDMPEGYKHFSKTKPMRVEHCQPIRDWWTDRKEIITTNDDGNAVDEKSRCFKVEELMAKSCNFDQCKFPKADEEVLPPAELLADYHKRRELLSKSIEDTICNIECIMAGGSSLCKSSNSNCFKELAEIIASLPARLRQSILQEAIQGRLVPQDPKEEPANELLKRIRKEKEQLLKEGKLKKKDLESKPIEEDEIPFEIPESWEWVRLKDITYKIVDGDHNPPRGLSYDTGYYMLSSKNINHNTIDRLDDVRWLSFEDWEKCYERTNLSKGDVLLTTVATLGRSCVYENTTPYCFQRSVSIISTYIYNYFLKYCFDSPYYQSLINEKATGTAQRGFYLNQLEESIIPLPPLSEQKRIVAKIEELFGVLKERI